MYHSYQIILLAPPSACSEGAIVFGLVRVRGHHRDLFFPDSSCMLYVLSMQIYNLECIALWEFVRYVAVATLQLPNSWATCFFLVNICQLKLLNRYC